MTVARDEYLARMTSRARVLYRGGDGDGGMQR